MNRILKEILISKKMRNTAALIVLAAAAVHGRPWIS
jgi:hypothetical protein